MRKNGINRELRPIEGGVCAPEGYKANAVACGIQEEGSLDFGMIFSERRCSVACVYAAGENVGAPVKVSKRNMRNGYARAILVNGGKANCLDVEGEQFALSLCDLLFPYGVERTEIVIASTGRLGERLEFAPFQKGIASLWEGLFNFSTQSEKVALAITTENARGKQLSYAFDLGDYPCKIGVVFKGGSCICPNMATFLAFLTTDVNISTPMLERVLKAEVKETLNMLNLDGTSSPNDTVCILANGKAGNCKIDCVDSEYKKFAMALRSTLTNVCYATARENAKKVLTCRVRGATSKEMARIVAKAVVGASGVKEGIISERMPTEEIIFTVVSSAKRFQTEEIELGVRSATGEYIFYMQDREIPLRADKIKEIFAEEQVEFWVDFHEGNYQALAFGRIPWTETEKSLKTSGKSAP